ncbi:hypothetical protein, partial [Candidatus Paracaedibacter symbiosus]|uniref:hypothetical protein n=1 Tax=Candidatus Paracaedibacter symbiosus TaxID=244582 RepID=UPI0005098102
HYINNDKILNECLRDYEGSLAQHLRGKIKRRLPIRKDMSPLGEHAGWYEKRIGLRATHQRVKQLEDENSLNVRSHIRIRDNLNRVREQIIDSEEERNRKIDQFNYPKEIATCVRAAAEFAQIVTPDISVVHSQFMHCFHNPLFRNNPIPKED